MSFRSGPSALPFKTLVRQEEWVRYTVAAKALGMSAPALYDMEEPERSFWYHRGLMMAYAEGKAMEEDRLDTISFNS